MIIVIIAFGFLIFIHEFAHFLVAKRMGVSVETFSLGFGPKIFSFKKKETEYRISLIPLGGYVKMAGDDPREARKGSREEFLSQPPGKRSLIVAAGPVGNYILGFLLFLYLFLFGFPTLGTKVGKVLKGYPADKYGLKTGDEIIAINGKSTQTWEELTELIHPNPERIVEVKIKRGKDVLEMKIKTTAKEIRDFLGRKEKIGLLGITPDTDNILRIRYRPARAFLKAGRRVEEITKITFLALINIITGKLSFRESVSGPVGIFYLSEQAIMMGFHYFLSLMAVISTSLAIFNILPIPVLDGGHLFFIFLEKIRKKPVPVKVQETLTQISMTLLLILVLFVTYFDFVRFFSK